MKYARRKPAAKNGANGTSTPILEPAGLRNNKAIPTNAPTQNEKMKPERAAGPARSARPKASGASARPIARPREKKWMSAKLIAMRRAMMSSGRNVERDGESRRRVAALAATNTARSDGGSI